MAHPIQSALFETNHYSPRDG